MLVKPYYAPVYESFTKLTAEWTTWSLLPLMESVGAHHVQADDLWFTFGLSASIALV